MTSISRRDFLKLGALALGGMAFTSYLPEFTGYDDSDLARVCIPSVSIFKQPSDESRIVGQWFRDDVVRIYETVTAETPAYNPVWYRVWGGYMHRQRMQRVKIRYNQPLVLVPENGMLAEVTVPYSQAYFYNKWDGWKSTYRLYYSTVHWVKTVEDGPDGQPWYRILDELDETTYLAPAAHLRPIPPEEIAPIGPEIPFEAKRILVNLTTQTVTAYEYDQPVFETKISSGLSGISTSDIPTGTPTGNFNVVVKMPSKHMGEANLAADIADYVLPGVPWTTFFTEQGHAFHGAYWHDNFGVPMSHGCINMRPDDAKWIFRWTRPLAPFEDINPLTLDRKGHGTLIQVRS
jgi:hypothetical protein